MSSLTATDPDAPQLGMRAALGNSRFSLAAFLVNSRTGEWRTSPHPPEEKGNLVSLYEIFSAASDIDDPRERQQYLDDACGDDAELRERLEALLRSANAAEIASWNHPPRCWPPRWICQNSR